ncbi:MAG: LLM class flavin-dependent oxidoreductase [Acidimicrobiaceae bacterium]|nr:LLM class flavin-dependent oxidoreductase [Acidimicrobiaceae bacterium]
MPPLEQFDDLLRQVDVAQRSGFTLIALGQHVLYGDVRWLQPVPTLARLAAELDPVVRVATTVLIEPLHHPVMLAEELATLDIVTGGRLDVGLGVGYRREEFEQLGVPFADRTSLLEETVAVLRAMWSEERVTFDGRHWQLSNAEPHIHPVQRPSPPIWIGASSEAGVRRAARIGDAWPIGPRLSLDRIRELLAAFDDARATSGRPAARHPIRREIVIGADRDAARARFHDMTAERYEAYAARERGSIAGGDENSEPAIVGTPDQVVDEVLRMAAELPVGPVITRVQWPGMTAADVHAYVEDLGRHVVHPIRAALGSTSA